MNAVEVFTRSRPAGAAGGLPGCNGPGHRRRRPRPARSHADQCSSPATTQQVHAILIRPATIASALGIGLAPIALALGLRASAPSWALADAYAVSNAGLFAVFVRDPRRRCGRALALCSTTSPGATSLLALALGGLGSTPSVRGSSASWPAGLAVLVVARARHVGTAHGGLSAKTGRNDHAPLLQLAGTRPALLTSPRRRRDWAPLYLILSTRGTASRRGRRRRQQLWQRRSRGGARTYSMTIGIRGVRRRDEAGWPCLPDGRAGRRKATAEEIAGEASRSPRAAAPTPLLTKEVPPVQHGPGDDGDEGAHDRDEAPRGRGLGAATARRTRGMLVEVGSVDEAPLPPIQRRPEPFQPIS